MGTVYLDTKQIGTFTPDTIGTTGDVYYDAEDIGDFVLHATGYVYYETTIIGQYTTADSFPNLETAIDARYMTKVYLERYLKPTNLLQDHGAPAVYAVIYAYPPYPIDREFNAASDPVDLLFLVGEVESNPVRGLKLETFGYDESVPVTVCCVDKTGLTGTMLKWTAEAELRRVLETYPYGSIRAIKASKGEPQRMGTFTVYSSTVTLRYVRTKG